MSTNPEKVRRVKDDLGQDYRDVRRNRDSRGRLKGHKPRHVSDFEIRSSFMQGLWENGIRSLES